MAAPERGLGAEESLDHRIQAYTTRFALKLEVTVSIARLVFISALMARLLWQWDNYGSAHSTFSLTAYLVVILLSFYPILARHQLEAHSAVVLPLSVALDGSIAFLALLPNAFWPPAGHPGIIHTIEIAGLLVAATAGGVRLSPRVALFGGVLNLCSFLTLLGVEWWMVRTPILHDLPHVVLFLIFLFGCSALAYIVAERTRGLAMEAALDTIRLERSRRSIESLLRDHHDLRSVLTSATLRADLLEAGSFDAADPGGPPDASAAAAPRLVVGLQNDLRRMRTFFNDIKERAFRDLFAPDPLELVEVTPTVQEALDEVHGRFPAVTLVFPAPSANTWVHIRGGADSLRRILVNLVTNACEGNGTEGANRVEVQVEEPLSDEEVTLVVRDNGPGFPPPLLGRPIGEDLISTKPGGAGLGLTLSARLVRISSGELDHENGAGGGAEVRVRLPRGESVP